MDGGQWKVFLWPKLMKGNAGRIICSNMFWLLQKNKNKKTQFKAVQGASMKVIAFHMLQQSNKNPKEQVSSVWGEEVE